MKKIMVSFVLCLIISALTFNALADGINVKITDISNDIITISGSAPIDSRVSIMILNPGKVPSDASVPTYEAVNYFGHAYSKNGSFTKSFKMNTGVSPNKTEGTFTIVLSIDGDVIYKDDNFLFYSNETKTESVNDLKYASSAELLSVVGSTTKIEKIFETYSLSNHELYISAKKEDLAKSVVSQSSRTSLSTPADVEEFLVKVLVFNAFQTGNEKLKEQNGLKYTDVWASSGGVVSDLYTDNFKNDLRADGQENIVDGMLSAQYNDLSDVFDAFENLLYYNIIMNNIALGSGHIEDLVLTEFNTEYKALGFDTDTLSSITDGEIKSNKLHAVLNCGATDINSLKTKFNNIMTDDSIGKSENQSGTLTGTVTPPASGGVGGSSGGTSVTPPIQPITPTVESPFVDMQNSTWAIDAVNYLYNNKIINGRTDKEFVPQADVSRAELVKMIVEAFDIEKTDTDITFGDINNTDWYAEYVKRATAAGIVFGSGGNFKPNDGITREDAAVILYRTIKLDAKGEKIFNDSGDISDYAKDAVGALAHAGLINGMGDGTFSPKTTLSRAQAAQLIYNALIGGK